MTTTGEGSEANGHWTADSSPEPDALSLLASPTRSPSTLALAGAGALAPYLIPGAPEAEEGDGGGGELGAMVRGGGACPRPPPGCVASSAFPAEVV